MDGKSTDDLGRGFRSRFVEPNRSPRGGIGNAGWYGCERARSSGSSYKSEGSSSSLIRQEGIQHCSQNGSRVVGGGGGEERRAL